MEAVQWLHEYDRRIKAGEDLDVFMGVDITEIEQAEHIAFQLYKTRSYQKAQDILEGLIALKPSRPYAYRLLGDIALQSYLISEAYLLLKRAETLEPGDLWTQARLGEASLLKGYVSEAVELLQQVVKNSEDPQSFMCRRAVALLHAVKARA